jgi:DNA-binding CsgD family transcriptional regulator
MAGDEAYGGGGMETDYRAGDNEREHTIDQLRAHCAAGRLTSEELLDRSVAAQEAVTRSDLATLLQDLPDLDPPRRAWREPGWRAHVAVAVPAIGAMIGLWQLTRDPTPAPKDYGIDYWWPLWVGLWWGLALVLHYLHADGRLNLPTRWPRPTPESPPRTAATTADDDAHAALITTLTPREQQILALLTEGNTNQQIARRLHISERTARTHVSNILHKLDVPSRTQAALAAVHAGLQPRP